MFNKKHTNIALYTHWFSWKMRPHHFMQVAETLGHEVEVFSAQSWADHLRNMLKYGSRYSPDLPSPKQLQTTHVLPSPRFDSLPFCFAYSKWQRTRLLHKWEAAKADIHIFQSPPTVPVTSKPSLLVYDCMDDWSDYPGLPKETVENEQRLCRLADRIWVISESVRQKFAKEYGEKVEYVPNGVDYEHFGITSQLRATRQHVRPTLGYVGTLFSWFDANLVGAVAKKLPDWDIVLVGPIGLNPEQKQALNLPNVRCIGRQPYKRLPELMADFQVAMIPFVINDLILGTSPIKLYEYLAAGLPVVSTLMPEVLAMQEEGVISCCDNPDDFAKAVQSLAQSNDNRLFADRREKIAQEHTWQSRFTKALTHLHG